MFLNLFNFSEPVRSFHFSDLEQMVLAGGVGSWLLAACLVGGAIGVEREYHRDVIAQIQRISFSVLGTRGQHQVLMTTLRASPMIGQLHTYHDAEDE